MLEKIYDFAKNNNIEESDINFNSKKLFEEIVKQKKYDMIVLPVKYSLNKNI